MSMVHYTIKFMTIIFSINGMKPWAIPLHDFQMIWFQIISYMNMIYCGFVSTHNCIQIFQKNSVFFLF